MIELAPQSTDVILNWKDANLYCFLLNIDGKLGWRLPTLDEMMDIGEVVDSSLILPAAYWTSNQFVSSTVQPPEDIEQYCIYLAPLREWSAWYVSKSKSCRVRAVRDIYHQKHGNT